MTRTSRTWAGRWWAGRSWAPAVLLVVALVLAACGSDGAPTTGLVGGPVETTNAVSSAASAPAPTQTSDSSDAPGRSSSPAAEPGEPSAGSPAPSRPSTSGPASAAQAGSADADAGVAAGRLLGELTVRPAAGGGYDRKLFRHWVDADGDGCDTRAEVLIRQSAKDVTRTATCRVLTGRWTSAYDDRVITDAGELDIDHLVPLAEAWRSGAHRWDAATRSAFANDLDYRPALIAVSASTNRSKGDRPPHQWMPPSAEHGCTYVGEWTATKWRWQLSVTKAEKQHLRQKIKSCGGVRVPKPARAAIGSGPDLAGGAKSTPRSTKAAKKSEAPKKRTKPEAPKAPSVSGPVHPGAFCAPAGAKGKTRAGTRMECKSTAADTRNRWRAA